MTQSLGFNGKPTLNSPSREGGLPSYSSWSSDSSEDNSDDNFGSQNDSGISSGSEDEAPLLKGFDYVGDNIYFKQNKRKRDTLEEEYEDREEFCSPSKNPLFKTLILRSPKSPSLDRSIQRSYNTALEEHYYKSPKKQRLATAGILKTMGSKLLKSLKKAQSASSFQELFKHTNEVGNRPSPEKTSKAVHIHTTKLQVGSGAQVTVHHKVYSKSGLRDWQLTGVSTYDDISKKISNIKDATDAQIAEAIWDILHGREDYKQYITEEKDVKLLTKLCYLLFSAECSREPGSYIAHAMFIDLVKDGHLQMSDLTKLPMSIEGAVKATRTLNRDIYKKDGVKQPSRPDPKITDEIPQNLLDNYHFILSSWLKNISVGNFNIKDDLQKIEELIRAKVQDWYKIDLPELRYSLDGNYIISEEELLPEHDSLDMVGTTSIDCSDLQ